MGVYGGVIVIKLDDFCEPFGGIQDLFEPGVDVRYGSLIVELGSEGIPFRYSCRASPGRSTCVLDVELNDVVVTTKSVWETGPDRVLHIPRKGKVGVGVS